MGGGGGWSRGRIGKFSSVNFSDLFRRCIREQGKEGRGWRGGGWGSYLEDYTYRTLFVGLQI